MKTAYIAVSLAVGIIISYFVYANINITEFFATITQMNPWLFALYIAVTFVIHLLMTWKWGVILKSQEHPIPLFTLFLYRLCGHAISYITPIAHIGGEPFRAVLLQRHGMSFSQGFSSVVIDKSIELTFNLFFGLIGFLVLFFWFALPSNAIFVIYAIVISLAFFALFYYQMFRGGGFFTPFFRLVGLPRFHAQAYQHIVSFEQTVISFFRHHKRAFLRILIAPFLWWGLMLLEYWLVLRLVGLEGSLLQIFLVIAGVSIAYFIPLPAALGVLETIQIFVFALLGAPAAAAAALSVIIRVKDIWWTLPGLGLLPYFGIRLRKAITNGQK